jgi:hypothetical protein
MSWATTGYDLPDDNYGNGSSEKKSSAVRTFWTSIGATKRIIILDDDPFGFWQHSLWNLGVKGDKPICLDRNGNLSQTYGKCPFCEMNDLHYKTNGNEGMKLYPSFTAYITVIDCGEVKNGPTGPYLEGWVNDQGREYNFDRKLLPLNKGGKDKPGLLPKIRRLREKKGGSLVGCVYDLYRGGKKEERPGTEWDYVARVDVSTVEALRASIKALEGYRPDHHDTLASEVDDNGVIDYMGHFEPQSRDELMNLIPKNNRPGYPSSEGSGSGYGGSGWGDTSSQDDIKNGDTDTKNYGDEDIPF